MLHMILHWLNLANLSETFTFYLHVVATNSANAKLLLHHSFIPSSSINNLYDDICIWNYIFSDCQELQIDMFVNRSLFWADSFPASNMHQGPVQQQLNCRLKSVVVREFTWKCHCYSHFDSTSHNITTFKYISQLLLLNSLANAADIL